MNGSFYVICQMDANASNGGSSSSCDLNSPYYGFSRRLGDLGVSTSSSPASWRWSIKPMAARAMRIIVLYPMAAQERCELQFQHCAASTNSSCIFYDVTVGNNSVICQGGSPELQ